MKLDMDMRVGTMGLVIMWFYAVHCMGQITPRSLVTADYFNSLLASVSSTCEGKSFYKYDDFITTAEAAVGFGTTGSDDVHKREVAAFLAHVMHNTGGLCFINERNPDSNRCDPSYTQWPCAPGKSYFGRGPMQLSWNYNYGPAGNDLGFDGLKNPEVVGQNPQTSFKTAFWFWMKNCHDAIVSGKGFGATIKAINSLECKVENHAKAEDRVSKYRKFCSDFGVDPGLNIFC
ncbi:class IV chitinase Chia4-Pa1.1 [Cinnamomum micranthum f. kanehirae]|uniref:Class IV chitinase Chia4-Pa1.1 n=1 Tax=Cinnamomum micranthum f. kanehirae TaxID=337451 RepID=A0A3S3MH94_9MAGN|nr:class IV chitinase Chia4-Pa1.1 [Cinnamomum micranthum f. kanehirae]